MNNTRFRITRKLHENHVENAISLEECKVFFAEQHDFLYTQQYSVRQNGTVMTIEGEFFMWQVGETQIPFRYYDGDIYVFVSHEIIYAKMLSIAEELHAQYIEG